MAWLLTETKGNLGDQNARGPISKQIFLQQFKSRQRKFQSGLSLRIQQRDYILPVSVEKKKYISRCFPKRVHFLYEPLNRQKRHNHIHHAKEDSFIRYKILPNPQRYFQLGFPRVRATTPEWHTALVKFTTLQAKNSSRFSELKFLKAKYLYLVIFHSFRVNRTPLHANFSPIEICLLPCIRQ